jgi:hypothetical protein
MTAANLGSRITGYGFCVFLVGSISWFATGLLTHQPALVWTNAVLTVLNAFGIWRWLGRQAKIEEGGAAASQASERTPGESLFPVSLLMKSAIEDRGGNARGSCVDAMAGCSTGKLSYVVMSEGGIGGVGEILRRLSWDNAHFDGDRLVADRFDDLPEIPKDEWPAR